MKSLLKNLRRVPQNGTSTATNSSQKYEVTEEAAAAHEALSERSRTDEGSASEKPSPSTKTQQEQSKPAGQTEEATTSSLSTTLVASRQSSNLSLQQSPMIPLSGSFPRKPQQEEMDNQPKVLDRPKLVHTDESGSAIDAVNSGGSTPTNSKREKRVSIAPVGREEVDTSQTSTGLQSAKSGTPTPVARPNAVVDMVQPTGIDELSFNTAGSAGEESKPSEASHSAQSRSVLALPLPSSVKQPPPQSAQEEAAVQLALGHLAAARRSVKKLHEDPTSSLPLHEDVRRGILNLVQDSHLLTPTQFAMFQLLPQVSQEAIQYYLEHGKFAEQDGNETNSENTAALDRKGSRKSSFAADTLPASARTASRTHSPRGSKATHNDSSDDEDPEKKRESNSASISHDNLIHIVEDFDEDGNASSNNMNSSVSSRASTAKMTEDKEGLSNFVSEIALSSFQLSVHDEPVIMDCEVGATLLQADIAGYYRVSELMQEKGSGAYVIYNVVNEYFGKLLSVVREFNGQVVRCTGNSLQAIWYYKDENNSVNSALHCAIALQKACGKHIIPSLDDQHFALQIGVSTGTITSSVFRSTSVKNMESCFHLLYGEPLQEITRVVEAARNGEVCLTAACLDHSCLGMRTSFRSNGANSSNNIFVVMDMNTADCTCDPRVHRRDLDLVHANLPLCHDLGNDVELDFAARTEHIRNFVPPKLMDQLKKGKTHAEMASLRLLTVLNIHKTDTAIDIADWFEEVQSVVEQYNCSIVTLRQDHSGIFLMAAVNLYASDREPAVTGIKLARSLLSRRCGCTIGLATGMVFCGVIGDKHTSRVDVAGWICRRAHQLMEHALVSEVPVVIGESVVFFSGDQSLTTPLGSVVLSDNSEVKIFSIGEVDTTILSSITTAGTACMDVHKRHRDKLISQIVNSPEQRIGAVVRGSSNSGKHMLCASAMYGTGFVCMSHTGVSGSRPLDLLWTLGMWFKYHRSPELSETATKLIQGLTENHNIRSTAIALDLVNQCIKMGLKYCIIIRHCQRLDQMSMSFVRQVLRVQRDHSDSMEKEGRFVVLATVVPQSGAQAWSAIATTMGRDTLTFRVGHLPFAECKAFIDYRLKWTCDHALLQAILVASSPLVGLIDCMITKLEEVGKGRMTVGTNGEMRGTEELRKQILLLNWSSISRQICAKSSMLFSELMLSTSAIVKIVAILSTPFLPINRTFAATVAAAILRGSKTRKVMKEIEFLVDMYLLEKRSLNLTSALMLSMSNEDMEHAMQHTNSEEAIEFESPVALNVTLETVLPKEFATVASAAVKEFENFHDLEHPREYFAYALHFFNAGRQGDFKRLMNEGLSRVAAMESEATAQNALHAEEFGYVPDPFEKEAKHLRLILALEMRKKGLSELNFVGLVSRSRQTAAENFLSLSGSYSGPKATISLESQINEVTSFERQIKDRRQSKASFDGKSESSDGNSPVQDKIKPPSSPESSPQRWKTIRELPPHIVKLKYWLPPIALGTLTKTLRHCSIFITELAVNASLQQETSMERVKEHRKQVELYCKLKLQIDRVVGFEPTISNEKEFLLSVGTPTDDFTEVSAYGRSFLEYIDSTITPRSSRIKQHVLRTMYVPFPPSYKPVFTGNERKSLETSLKNSLLNWKTDNIGSLRDGLMEIATQGWVPHSPEQNVEAQRDAYLRNRTTDMESFLSLLFVNLSVSTI